MVRSVNAQADRPPVITDVARLAGVSHQTVSRVLNQHPYVKQETRSRVLAAAATLGYEPNNAARALSTGRSHLLGVVTTPGGHFGPAAMSAAIESVAMERGYLVSAVTAHPDTASSVNSAVRHLVSQGADGVIIHAHLDSTGNQFGSVPVPFLVVDGPANATNILVDQAAGARQATEHLLSLGHSTVWHVAGPMGWSSARSRRDSWEATLRENGIDAPPVLIGDWTPASGYEQGRVLAGMPDVTAVFVANDQMAIGAIRALRDGGRRVPDDLAIVGFDDIPEAAFVSPSLTTVRADFEELGREAVRRILTMIEVPADGEGAASTDPFIGITSLIVRESSGARTVSS